MSEEENIGPMGQCAGERLELIIKNNEGQEGPEFTRMLS